MNVYMKIHKIVDPHQPQCFCFEFLESALYVTFCTICPTCVTGINQGALGYTTSVWECYVKFSMMLTQGIPHPYSGHFCLDEGKHVQSIKTWTTSNSENMSESLNTTLTLKLKKLTNKFF